MDARYLFGYTGYRSAKFGQIQVHERITETSRELLLKIKEMAEDMGFGFLHGIVDCLWVVGEPILKFKEAVERETGILTEVDSYNWITFLPMSDGGGAYNRSDKQKNTIKELLLNIQDKDLIGVDGTVRDRSPRDKRIMPCIQGGR